MDKKEFLNNFDIPNMTNEEKRFLVMDMIDVDFTADEIAEAIGYTKRQVLKITRAYNNYGRVIETPITDFTEYAFKDPDMWSSDEMDYGSGRNLESSRKYTFEKLSKDEKKIYRHLVKRDILKARQDEIKRTSEILKKATRSNSETSE